MKKLFFFAIVLTAFQFQACNSNTTKNEASSSNDSTYVDTTHNSQNAIDWAGVYDGVLPCADCAGIKTSIKLNDDNTFSYTAEYLDKNTTVQDTGKFMWHDNGSVVHLMGKDLNAKYKVGENQIIQLDESGKIIEGPLAEQYYLIKVQQ